MASSEQLIENLYSYEKKLISILETSARSVELINSSKDAEEIKSQFEEYCTSLGQTITEVQAGCRYVLKKLEEQGLLVDRESNIFPYAYSSAGDEKDLEIMTRGIELLVDVIKKPM